MKNILITGCSRGIGLATANLFLENGYYVIGTSTSGKVAISNPNFESLALNLGNDESVSKAVNILEVKNIRIDYIINNAAVLLEEWNDSMVNLETLRNTFNVNVFGLINLTEQLLPILNEGGHIINISSGWGSFSELDFHQFVPHYKMSKSTVNMYTKLLAERLKERNIKASSLDPGWVKSDMGGMNADREPAEAAYDIYNLINANVKSGLFWANGRTRSW